MSSASPLAPTYQGYIGSTQDALILFESCLNGSLNHVARRPHDRERANLIRSGNVFIYEEHSSGIKRWTDGIPWSPSRILGNFLVYRELERPFPPGEKKRAMKKTNRRSPPGISKHESYSNSSSMSSGYNQAASVASSFENAGSMSKETERSLIGSLVDSYGFKDDGLVKKTVSVTVGNVSHHLVSYYNVADVLNHKLTTPTKDPRFAQIQPRVDLISKQNFRTPIDEVDAPERLDDRNPYGASYTYPRSTYDMTNQSMGHRQMALPAPQVGFSSAPGIYQHYGMGSTGSSGYDSMAPPHPSSSFSSQFPPQVPFPHSGIKPDAYGGHQYRHTPTQQPPSQPARYNSIDGLGPDNNRLGMPPVGSLLARRASTAYEAAMESPLGPATSGAIESKLPSDGNYQNSPAYFNLRDEDQSQQHQHLRALPTPGHSNGYDRPPVASTYPTSNHQDQRDGTWYGSASNNQPAYMNSQPGWHSTHP